MMTPPQRMLVGHELRLAWRALGLDRWSIGLGGHIGLGIIALGLLHMAAAGFVAMAPRTAPDGIVAVTLLALMVALVLGTMLATALNRCVEALFIRNDLDLLFSSPVRPRDVLIARTLVVGLGTPLLWMLLLYPVANMAWVFDRPWLRGLYLSVPLAGLLCAALAMTLTLTLARRVGPRRTMVLSQVLGIAAGAGSYLLLQLGPRWPAQSGFAEGAAWLWPVTQRIAGLATGDGVALAAAALLTVVLLAYGSVRLERDFLRSAQAMHGDGAARERRSTAVRGLRIAAHPMLAICLKEWRCLLRDPLLLSRLAMSLVYLVPLVVPMLLDPGGAWRIPATLFGIVMAVGVVAQQLAQLMAHMEDLPELAYNAPRPLRQVLLAKAAAAAIPSLIVGTLLVSLAASTFGVDALHGLTFVVAAVAASTTVMVANTRVVPRANFGKGGQASGLDLALINALLLLMIGGAAAAFTSGYTFIALALVSLAGAFTVREGLLTRDLRHAWTLWRATS